MSDKFKSQRIIIKIIIVIISVVLVEYHEWHRRPRTSYTCSMRCVQ